jgi:type II secretory pathway pseudopilin PulG
MRSGDPAGDPAERGVTLVALVMIVTVLNILIAAALPLWSTRIRRDKEQELIARGFQYAEAIRVFQTRFGRLPNRLEELIEVEPRSIRQLWDDPIAGDNGWAVLVELPGAGLLALDSRTGQPIAPVDLDGDGKPDQLPQPAPPPGGGRPVLGPIHGVKCRISGQAFQTLFESDDHGEWEFTVEMLQNSIAKPGPTGLPPRTNALTLGRPFRYPPPGSAPPTPGGGLPQPPGGEPGTGSRPRTRSGRP